MKKQILIIGGGDTFKSYEEYLQFLRNFEIDFERYRAGKTNWKRTLGEKLGTDYEVFLPVMPNTTNAQYTEWKIWFEKLFPFLKNDVILIGHSLGASFLVKYLSENGMPMTISGVFLVSGVFDKDLEGYGLASFAIPDKFDLHTNNIYLYHSKDDPVVPFSAMERFAAALPKANTRILDDRGHINQEEFPELVDDILKLKV